MKLRALMSAWMMLRVWMCASSVCGTADSMMFELVIVCIMILMVKMGLEVLFESAHSAYTEVEYHPITIPSCPSTKTLK